MTSVYSLRPRLGAPVSTPLKWDEIRHDLDPFRFNIITVPARIEQQGDIWEGLPDSGIDLMEVISRMEH